MSERIIIKDTPVDIPTSGDSPNWAESVTEALKALADAVNVSTGQYDVPPQTLNIDSYNTATDISIDNLLFPSAEVLSAFIFYSVKRVTEDSGASDQQNATEEGTLEIVYNENNPVGNKWEIIRSFSGDAQISFSITDLGQVTFSTTTLTGINHTGIISYRALSILVQ